jgi:hypothetical protein
MSEICRRRLLYTYLPHGPIIGPDSGLRVNRPWVPSGGGGHDGPRGSDQETTRSGDLAGGGCREQ